MTAEPLPLSKSRIPETEPVTILHLEDSPLDAELAEAQIRRAGWPVVVQRAGTREEFEQALSAQRFDLILADYALPHFDGMEALRIVRSRHPELPFIMVSGRMGEEVAVETLKQGATDYVLKTRLDRLTPAIRRALAEVREREECRRAQRALYETEERFRALADSAPVMIWMAGIDKSLAYVSRHWVEFTGRSFEDNLRLEWTYNVFPEDLPRVLETFATAFDKRQNFTMEYRIRRHDGEYRWIVSNGVPRFGADGEFVGYIGSCMDITELKTAEEKLRHAAKLESLGVLAGGIAHDFNNLLTGIIGNACLLQDELEGDVAKSRLVENIVQAGETAARLTRQILAYSGKGKFVVELLDISEQVRTIAPLLEASVPKNVRLHFDLARDLPALEGDSGQIHQVIMNLVINGAEAIGSEPGNVDVITRAVGSSVLLQVRDTGHGMDEATVSRIFDPFFTTKFTGRGLGLAAVSGIVRSHRGEIKVESAPGAGTTFRVSFPASDGQILREAAVSKPVRGSETILVVDDEEIVRRIAKLGLERYGYNVITANNGQDAIDQLRAHRDRVSLIVLDMMMPTMSGWEALEHLKRVKPGVKVIVSSGYSEAEATRRFGEGISAFLQKPYRSQQLAETIRHLLH